MTDARRFRLRFWVVLLAYLVAIQVSVAVTWVVLWAVRGGGPPGMRPGTLQLLFSVKWAVMGGLMAGYMWVIWRVRVGPAGVETPKSYGPVAWDAVRDGAADPHDGLAVIPGQQPRQNTRKQVCPDDREV